MQPFNLKTRIKRDIFDYQTLISVLAGYAAPRDKITSLIEQGIIVRIKKGLYIWGDTWRQRPYSREALANLIYGPSYISLEYALQIYGLLPERVQVVTSVTTGRSRRFSTPVGNFSYRKIALPAFASGMDLLKDSSGDTYMAAIPEKALTDKIQSERGLPIRSMKEIERYLVENLRMDIVDLSRLDADRIEGFAAHYHSPKIRNLAAFIRHVQGRVK